MFPEFCEIFQQIIKERVVRTPQFVAKSNRSEGNLWVYYFWLASEMGAVVQDKP